MNQRHDVTRACSFGLTSLFLAIGIYVPVCFNAPPGFHAAAQANNDRSGSTSKSRAPATKPVVAKPLDPCAVHQADASLTLGPGVPGVQAVSDGNNYYSKDCDFYVVDITVPSDSSAPSFLPSFSIESGAVDLKKAYPYVENASSGTNYAGGFAVPNFKGCHIYHQETRIFVRNANANEFTLLSLVKARGMIDESTPYDPTKKCFLAAEGKGVVSYGLPFGSQPSKSGTKVYRVAVKVSLGSVSNWGGENLQQVRVKASHDGDIK
jgi:hypothetical protein